MADDDEILVYIDNYADAFEDARKYAPDELRLGPRLQAGRGLRRGRCTRHSEGLPLVAWILAQGIFIALWYTVLPQAPAWVAFLPTEFSAALLAVYLVFVFWWLSAFNK